MSRVHRGGHVGKAEASLVLTWPDGSSLADAEEAAKAALREAVRAAREVARG